MAQYGVVVVGKEFKDNVELAKGYAGRMNALHPDHEFIVVVQNDSIRWETLTDEQVDRIMFGD